MTLFADYDLWQIRRLVENLPVEMTFGDTHSVVREISVLKPEWRHQKVQSMLPPQDIKRLGLMDPHGPPPLRGVITGALPSTAPPRSPRFHFMRAREVIQLPDVTAVLNSDGVKIPDQAITVLYGPPGKGKSFVSLHLAMRAAQKMPVIYIAAEKFYLYKPRVWAWLQHFKGRDDQIFFQREAVDFASPAVVDEWIAAAGDIKPRLLVVDTVAASMKGDENTVQDTQKFIDGLRRVQQRWPMAVLLVHHSGKDQSRGVRGSSNWIGAADCMIALTANQQKIIRLRNVKQNNAVEFEDVHLQLQPVDLKFDNGKLAADPDDPAQTYQCPVVQAASADDYAESQNAALHGNKQHILEMLDGCEQGLTLAQIVRQTGIARTTVYRTLGQMTDALFVQKDGDTYRITTEGQYLLRNLA